MPWLGVTLQVARAHADALSEALLEAGACSVSLDDVDAPLVTLQALLDEHANAAELLERAAGAAQLGDSPPMRLSWVQDDDWVRRSQSQFEPFVHGARLWIGPSWHEPPAAAQAVVRLDPGIAFGTGSHATTQLALRYLAAEIRGGERVLDYGCGSGILAIAAAKLGAGAVAATDIDPEALRTTAANARANGVPLSVGWPEGLASQRYDMVVANILAQPLIVLAPLLSSHTLPRGRIALSGILESQAAEVLPAYRDSFDIEVSAAQEGWVLLAGRRR
jgi:ribosomal protein L11 methyltransferase